MRLTTDLVKDSLSYINPLKERELDLRELIANLVARPEIGHRIPTIENLGAAGSHDAIDFTDNNIHLLGNIPLSPRLTTLLLARNRVSSIQPGVAKNIPHLRNLVLAENEFAELADLDALADFRRLTHLILINNPATKKENYRYWVIWRCPTVRFLDFVKVKAAERRRAEELFGTSQEPTELASKIMGNKSRIQTSTLDSTAVPTSKLGRMKLTDAERNRLQDMIKKASSLEEIIRLEKMLNEGRLPAGVQGGDVTMQE